MTIRLRQGYDLPIDGAPRQEIGRTHPPARIALLERDLPRSRHVLRVAVGDRVRVGQTLFADRNRPSIVFVAPVAGRVVMATPSDPRSPLAVVLEVEGDGGSRGGDGDGDGDGLGIGGDRRDGRAQDESPRSLDEILRLGRDEVTRRLLTAGEWPALRERPFGRIPDPEAVPDALFVRGMDTNPLSPKAAVVLQGRMDELRVGVAVLSRLLAGPVFFCCEPALAPPLEDLERVRVVGFSGPHPAGLPGTHIHHLMPLRGERRVWTIAYQDVVAIGHLFATGEREVERVVALAGPHVVDPRLVRVPIGASSEDLVRGELRPGPCRIVSGSLLTGRRAASGEAHLGLGHEQLLALPEADGAGPDAWDVPGWPRPRRVPPWRRRRPVTTAHDGLPRAMLPMPYFEDLVPLRLPVALLLRALAAGDLESARRFGALELEEEDVALCSLLCPSKLEYGALLRHALDHLGASPR